MSSYILSGRPNVGKERSYPILTISPKNLDRNQ